jgi:FAD/FMN-containing dehydrogenase
VAPTEALVRQLERIVGPGHVVTDLEVIAGYTADFTGRFRGHTAAVVRPLDAAQVAAVLSVCRAEGVALVPQGGNTGLVGGGVPLRGEVVLSLRRLDVISDVDPVGGQLTAGAGVTVGAVQRAATDIGWAYGVDLSSRDSATVGGTIATNAGGLRVLRHGDTRAQLLGVEAVLGTGEVVSHLGGLLKDNTGYHLPSLLCGSEGTLGVVTAARLRLVPPPHEPVVALVALSSVPGAVELAGSLRRELPGLEAVELFFDEGLDLVCTATGVAPPFARRHRAYLVVELSGGEPAAAALAGLLEGSGAMANSAVALDPVPAAALWRYREAHTEAINSIGPPHKMDVTLPPATLAEFVEAVPGAVTSIAPQARTWLFGHAADGNIHVNVTGVAPEDEAVDAVVLELAAAMGGSISAEHGIGTAKRRWLHLNRTPAELSTFATLKRALDPDNVLNPNVLLGG